MRVRVCACVRMCVRVSAGRLSDKVKLSCNQYNSVEVPFCGSLLLTVLLVITNHGLAD